MPSNSTFPSLLFRISFLMKTKLIFLRDKIKSFFTQGNVRSLAVKKNIAASLVLKCISILISLQVVPLTINYINPTRYGIWLTLSSIIAWLSYFDLGFAHGFRNRFAEAKAKNDIKLAKEYVSTTYAVLFILFSIIFIIATILNHFLKWGSILNIDASYNAELQSVFSLLACFFCMNIVASIFTTMLTADQKPALASLIQTTGQALAFIAIYILTKTTSGSLTALAFTFSGIPCFLLILVSVVVFHSKRYRCVSPSVHCIRFSLTKKILGLGGQFFIIQIACLVIFSTSNFLIIRFCTPQDVTLYNIVFKYFSILTMGFTIFITPFWSAVTEAYVKKDFQWIKKSINSMFKLWLTCVAGAILMLLFSDYFYLHWVNLQIPFSYSLILCCYAIISTWNNLFAYFLNGIGKMKVQLYSSIMSAFIFLTGSLLTGSQWGVNGIAGTMCLSLLISSIALPVQYGYIINERKSKFWNA